MGGTVQPRLKRSARVLLTLAVVALAAAGLPGLAAADGGPAPLGDPGLTLKADPGDLHFGDTVRIRAHLSVPGAVLHVSRAYAGDAEYAPVQTLLADGRGDTGWKDAPLHTATYRVEYGGDAQWAAAVAEVSVTVRDKVSLSTSAAARVRTGGRVTVKVAVAPARTGTSVDVQEWDAKAGVWETLTTLALDEQSRAQWVWRPQELGRHRLRARVAASAESPVAVSGVRSVRVYDAGDPYGVPASYPHLILVDLSQCRLYYYEHGRVIRTFACVLGRPSLPTPRGHFKIYAKDPDMYGAYGPRRLRYLGAYAVHGTNEPWLLERWPRNYSHGCTRLANADILWLFDRVHVGTPVWNVP